MKSAGVSCIDSIEFDDYWSISVEVNISLANTTSEGTLRWCLFFG